MRPLLSALFLLLPQLALASSPTLTIEQELADLHQLQKIIAEDYAPLKIKRERFGLELDQLVLTFENKLVPMPKEDFGYLLKQFIAEFRDSHFMSAVPVDRKAYLGFTVEEIEGKILIEQVERKYLTEDSFPFARGDELVSFGGISVDAAIRELQTYTGMGSEVTARNMAVYFLTLREGKRSPVPSGNVSLAFRKRGSAELSSVTIPWQIKSGSLKAEALRPLQSASVGLADFCSEISRISPPAGAEMIQDVPFTAFTFPTAKGKVGFIRIPHYFPVNKLTGEEEAALRFSQYEKVIARLERETAGLIIDQDFNCGGSILYANKLLSLFVRDSFSPMDIAFRASRGQIEGLSRHLAKQSPQSEGYSEFSSIIEEIRKALKAGLPFTPRLPVRGVMEVKLPMAGGNRIEPNSIGYTKPILLLINEMSGSGGDLFPAMMKDLGRARLFGQPTMGAGGHIWDDPHLVLHHSGLWVNPTRSLLFRLNGEAIENSGITPHVPYTITTEDFMGGYSGYMQAATAELLQMI